MVHRNPEELTAEPKLVRRKMQPLTTAREELILLNEQLVKSKEQYRSFFEYAGTAMMVIDADTTILMANHKLKAITGYYNEVNLIRRKWTEVVVPADIDRMMEYYLKSIRNPGSVPSEYEFQFIDRHGAKRDMLMSVSSIPNTEKYLISLVDLTCFKHYHPTLRKEWKCRNIVSRSPAMQQILDMLPDVAQSVATVLITGDSGTGKELIARSIHEQSNRKGKPFIAINCSALPDTLLESELFGYTAGAFTDAKKDKPGRFARAEGGTLFLDEIGDISPTLQIKLLRVLQERVYEPLGATRSVKSDIRIIAATNKNLFDMIKKGSFREDLFYRINTVSIQLPPLRERPGDIPLLCNYFIERFNSSYSKSIKGLEREALQFLLAYDFPGNVRELENSIEHAFIFCKESYINATHLPITVKKITGNSEKNVLNSIKSFSELERLYIESILSACNYDRTTAAKRLGIHKATLFRKLKRLRV